MLKNKESSPTTSLMCVKCKRPVTVNQSLYEVFEKMHWHCFHLEYEHPGDPDAPCNDPSCHEWRLLVYEEKLRDLGANPKQILEEAVLKRYNGG